MVKHRTRISFDLDGVLFVDPAVIETEPPLPGLLNRMYPDRLRKGTVRLIRRLQKERFSVWIYTSSYRSELYIKALFWHYRIRFSRIVNGYRHDKEVQRNRKDPLPSKMPNFYQISLHIDDEEIVIQNGRRYGFNVLRVSEQDPQWVEKIVKEAKRIREAENKAKMR